MIHWVGSLDGIAGDFKSQGRGFESRTTRQSPTKEQENEEVRTRSPDRETATIIPWPVSVRPLLTYWRSR